MLIDHCGLDVADFARARAFYDRALAPLGIAVIVEPAPKVCGYGRTGGGDVQAGEQSFWIGEGRAGGHLHLAFAARSREEVDAFHREAVAAGGIDNGAPGIREKYGPNYYAAFVLDPEGHNIEAVFNTG